MNKAVAKEIIKAQIASDGGKRMNEIAGLITIGKIYYKKGYDIKDICIKKAIKLINSNKNSGFYYNVKYCDKFNRKAYIVYFNFKINNISQQISFHTFCDLSRYINEKTVTRWKKRLNSRDTAILLAVHCDLTNA